MLIPKPYKVAVVDDSTYTLRIFEQIVKEIKDVEVVLFDNPIEALEVIKRDKIRIVFSDVNMPQMYGDDLLRELVSLRLGVLFFVITNEVSLITLDRCFNIGAKGFLTKPIEADRVIEYLSGSILFLDQWNNSIKKLVKKAS